MTVTGIKIRKVCEDEKMKAIVSVTLDESLAIHDIKVIKGRDRLFVAMPSRKAPDGHYVDIVHPISGEFREMLESVILKAYEEATALKASEEATENQ